MSHQETILKIANKNKAIVLDSFVRKNTTLLIDFYNIYCTLIKFCKFKTFSKETYIICFKRILNLIGDQKAIIVSKNIFEAPTELISELLKGKENITYIEVKDNFTVKSLNRERDDYLLLLFHSILTEKSVIITNDKFSNYSKLIADIKPLVITTIKEENITETEINQTTLNIANRNFTKNITRSGFSLSNKLKIYNKIKC